MGLLKRLASRFFRDESGAFLPIFGVMAVTLIAMSGASVDYVSMQQARNRAQVALDAAALSLQPAIYTDTDAQIEAKAEALLVQQIADSRITAEITGVVSDTTEGSLYFEATITVPTIFVSLVGVTELSPVIISEATRKKIRLEVAFVLDNSGSMSSSSRMSKLKTAAKNALEILFGGAATQDNVFVGIVPFTTMVNAGSSYANASWVDRGNGSSVANDNFDSDNDDTTAFSGNVDRIALFNQLSNVSWKGCFEARPYPLSTNDTAPTAANPDTLFVPAFAPDEPGGKGSNQSGFYNSYLSDTPSACTGPISTCTRTNYGNGWWWATITKPGGSTQSGWNVCSCSSSNTSCTFLSDREKQERLCKYTGSISTSYDGPNAGCPDAQILALTNTKASAITSINNMVASGGTNIHQGAIWGYHVLSPGLPFDQGVAYDDGASKVMILMTDGENTFYTSGNMNNAQFNQAYGFPYNEREGDMDSSNSSMASRMNTLLDETCDNVKAAGIEVYTIGLEPPNTTTKNLLRDCASGPSYAYFPSSANELGAIFEDIANQLSDLRLAQ